MNTELNEFIEQQLEKFSDKDVIIHYERGDLRLTLGFFAWNGYNHERTTLSELREDGWEKSDIKELRNDAKRICIIEHSPNIFEMVNGKASGG